MDFLVDIQTWLSNFYYHELPDPIRHIVWSTVGAFGSLLSPNSRLYWLFVISTILIATFAYRQYSNDERPSSSGFLRYLFPRKVYLHPSSIVDYKIWIANRVMSPLFHAPATVIGTAGVATYVATWLGSSINWSGFELTALSIALMTLTYAAASDFGSFLNHMIHHRVRYLWPLHSTHHSAEVLNPITFYRTHPLYDVVKLFIKVPIVGLIQGLVLFLTLGHVEIATVLGLNAIYAVFHLLGSNLRHTHIWISWGTVLNHIFVSPAHHQIHHSARIEHRDSNFGEVFAVWDWAFGTLVLPNEEIRRNMVIGIDLNAKQPHPTLAKAYLEPLTNIYKQLIQSLNPSSHRQRNRLS